MPCKIQKTKHCEMFQFLAYSNQRNVQWFNVSMFDELSNWEERKTSESEIQKHKN